MPGRSSPPYIRQLAEAMQQSIDQRAAIALVLRRSGTGVDHHSRGLVHHCQVIVFVNDIERNVFGDRAQRWRLRIAENRDLLAATQLERCLRRLLR